MAGYTTNDKLWGIVLNISEAGKIDHNIKHPQPNIVGNCGIDTRYWYDYLESKDIDIYGVAACIEIYKYYKENSSVRVALNKYKGANLRSDIIDKVIKTKQEANKYKHLLER